MATERDDARTEVAAAAARLIAEDGLDFATAKNKAAQALFGAGANLRSLLPDNSKVELELRRYLTTFAPERHRGTLTALRELAVMMMRRLAQFNPHLVGAVLNGTATEHSNLHLHLFTDDAKAVELFLLEQGVDFDVTEGNGRNGEPMESLQFVVRPARARGMPSRIGVQVDVYAVDAIRVSPRFRSAAPDLHPVEASGRASLPMLERLVADGLVADDGTKAPDSDGR